MNTYFRIQSRDEIYDGEFTTLQEAQSWIMARNIANLENDIINKKSYAFEIAEVIKTECGANILSVTPFDFVNGTYIFGETFKY